MIDPTRDEILAFLADKEGTEADREHAIQWFAVVWCPDSEESNLHQALLDSPRAWEECFPPDPDTPARVLYEALVSRFVRC